MNEYSLAHLSDDVLRRDMHSLVRKHREADAALLAHIGEFDARKLYLPKHPSMCEYCIHELRLSDYAALKRIGVARKARRFPIIFAAIADGRLHLTGVRVLVPYLTEDTADDLLAQAMNRTRVEIELLIAHRFPKADVPARVTPVAQSSPLASGTLVLASSCQLAPGPVALASTDAMTPTGTPPLAIELPPPPARVKPLAPERYMVQFTASQAMHDKLRHVQSLLSHQIPSGDVAQVFEKALDALVAQLEKSKFAATPRPRATQPASEDTRHIPSRVKRAVWQRDDGRCTYVDEQGRRCTSRRFLEYDHALEFARGGEATVDNLRLRCRPHNQFAAEQTYGAGFMRGKREGRQRAAS